MITSILKIYIAGIEVPYTTVNISSSQLTVNTITSGTISEVGLDKSTIENSLLAMVKYEKIPIMATYSTSSTEAKIKENDSIIFEGIIQGISLGYTTTQSNTLQITFSAVNSIIDVLSSARYTMLNTPNMLRSLTTANQAMEARVESKNVASSKIVNTQDAPAMNQNSILFLRKLLTGTGKVEEVNASPTGIIENTLTNLTIPEKIRSAQSGLTDIQKNLEYLHRATTNDYPALVPLDLLLKLDDKPISYLNLIVNDIASTLQSGEDISRARVTLESVTKNFKVSTKTLEKALLLVDKIMLKNSNSYDNGTLELQQASTLSTEISILDSLKLWMAIFSTPYNETTLSIGSLDADLQLLASKIIKKSKVKKDFTQSKDFKHILLLLFSGRDNNTLTNKLPFFNFYFFIYKTILFANEYHLSFLKLKNLDKTLDTFITDIKYTSMQNSEVTILISYITTIAKTIDEAFGDSNDIAVNKLEFYDDADDDYDDDDDPIVDFESLENLYAKSTGLTDASIITSSAGVFNEVDPTNLKTRKVFEYDPSNYTIENLCYFNLMSAAEHFFYNKLNTVLTNIYTKFSSFIEKSKIGNETLLIWQTDSSKIKVTDKNITKALQSYVSSSSIDRVNEVISNNNFSLWDMLIFKYIKNYRLEEHFNTFPSLLTLDASRIMPTLQLAKLRDFQQLVAGIVPSKASEETAWSILNKIYSKSGYELHLSQNTSSYPYKTEQHTDRVFLVPSSISYLPPRCNYYKLTTPITKSITPNLNATTYKVSIPSAITSITPQAADATTKHYYYSLLYPFKLLSRQEFEIITNIRKVNGVPKPTNSQMYELEKINRFKLGSNSALAFMLNSIKSKPNEHQDIEVTKFKGSLATLIPSRIVAEEIIKGTDLIKTPNKLTIELTTNSATVLADYDKNNILVTPLSSAEGSILNRDAKKKKLIPTEFNSSASGKSETTLDSSYYTAKQGILYPESIAQGVTATAVDPNATTQEAALDLLPVAKKIVDTEVKTIVNQLKLKNTTEVPLTLAIDLNAGRVISKTNFTSSNDYLGQIISKADVIPINFDVYYSVKSKENTSIASDIIDSFKRSMQELVSVMLANSLLWTISLKIKQKKDSVSSDILTTNLEYLTSVVRLIIDKAIIGIDSVEQNSVSFILDKTVTEDITIQNSIFTSNTIKGVAKELIQDISINLSRVYTSMELVLYDLFDLMLTADKTAPKEITTIISEYSKGNVSVRGIIKKLIAENKINYTYTLRRIKETIITVTILAKASNGIQTYALDLIRDYDNAHRFTKLNRVIGILDPTANKDQTKASLEVLPLGLEDRTKVDMDLQVLMTTMFSKKFTNLLDENMKLDKNILSTILEDNLGVLYTVLADKAEAVSTITSNLTSVTKTKNQHPIILSVPGRYRNNIVSLYKIPRGIKQIDTGTWKGHLHTGIDIAFNQLGAPVANNKFVDGITSKIIRGDIKPSELVSIYAPISGELGFDIYPSLKGAEHSFGVAAVVKPTDKDARYIYLMGHMYLTATLLFIKKKYLTTLQLPEIKDLLAWEYHISVNDADKEFIAEKDSATDRGLIYSKSSRYLTRTIEKNIRAVIATLKKARIRVNAGDIIGFMGHSGAHHSRYPYGGAHVHCSIYKIINKNYSSLPPVKAFNKINSAFLLEVGTLRRKKNLDESTYLSLFSEIMDKFLLNPLLPILHGIPVNQEQETELLESDLRLSQANNWGSTVTLAAGSSNTQTGISGIASIRNNETIYNSFLLGLIKKKAIAKYMKVIEYEVFKQVAASLGTITLPVITLPYIDPYFKTGLPFIIDTGDTLILTKLSTMNIAANVRGTTSSLIFSKGLDLKVMLRFYIYFARAATINNIAGLPETIKILLNRAKDSSGKLTPNAAFLILVKALPVFPLSPIEGFTSAIQSADSMRTNYSKMFGKTNFIFDWRRYFYIKFKPKTEEAFAVSLYTLLFKDTLSESKKETVKEYLNTELLIYDIENFNKDRVYFDTTNFIANEKANEITEVDLAFNMRQWSTTKYTVKKFKKSFMYEGCGSNEVGTLFTIPSEIAKDATATEYVNKLYSNYSSTKPISSWFEGLKFYQDIPKFIKNILKNIY